LYDATGALLSEVIDCICTSFDEAEAVVDAATACGLAEDDEDEEED